jgi:hypothetical protein
MLLRSGDLRDAAKTLAALHKPVSCRDQMFRHVIIVRCTKRMMRMDHADIGRAWIGGMRATGIARRSRDRARS